MATKKLKKTNNLSDVTKVCTEIGDKLANQYDKTDDLKVCQTALKAYNTAISAGKTQLIYKKLTGKPKNNKFFE